jgi:hypothetical protein
LAALALALLLAAAAHAQPAGAGSGQPPPRPPLEEGPQTLSAEQLAKVKSVLARYKAATLTADDAKAIKRALRDAGLRRGPGVAAAIKANGFDPDRLEQLDPRPPGPPPGERPERPDGPPPVKK